MVKMRDCEPFYFRLCYLNFAGWWKGIRLTSGWYLRVTRTALDKQLEPHADSPWVSSDMFEETGTSYKGSLSCSLRRGLPPSLISHLTFYQKNEADDPIRTEAGIEVLLLLFFLPLWKRWVDWGFQAPVWNCLSCCLLSSFFWSSIRTPIPILLLKLRLADFALTTNI